MNITSMIRTGFLAAFAGLVLAACGGGTPTAVDRLAEKAQAAAVEAALATTDPHEIKTIERRRNLMGQPGLQLYVVFMNDMGQPVEYFVTQGKCTSSTKRLTPDEILVQGDRGSYTGWFAVPAASEDGTYGSSDEYTYCKTADGKYKQWNGDIYVSDAPVELVIKPLIIDVVADGESGIQGQQ